MPTAYLVCGAPSSGNRLVAAILCRSGCAGEGSTNQPAELADIPAAGYNPYVLIRHRNVAQTIAALQQRGFTKVVAIVVVREPVATVRSMVNHGHQPTEAAAKRHRDIVIADNIADLDESGIPFEIVTYEGLTEDFLHAWLPTIGLPYVMGPLSLPGQLSPPAIRNQNAKHCSVGDADTR